MTQQPEQSQFKRVQSVMTRLLRECPWHAEQTHESLTRYLTEEAAEFIDAVGTDDAAQELGDVLYQVLFHIAIAERDGDGYDLESVSETLANKLIARHPHVFSDSGYMSVSELNAQWEHLKEAAAGQQRGSRGVLEGIPQAMPTLAKATKVVNRLRRAQHKSVPQGLGEKLAAANFTEHEIATAIQLLEIIDDADSRGLSPDYLLRRALIEIEDMEQ
jgi:uncharacterized protein YabN with tetrapyrrole methylase and pyrophosphatase domain